MQTLLINLLLALAWIFMTGEFTPLNLLLGFALSYLVLIATRELGGRSSYFAKLGQALGFTVFFIRELILSNLRVAYDVITPRPHMRPGVLAIPLDAKTDLEIAIFANLLTLTPGTMSLDVSDDRTMLYAHVMYIDNPDQTRREIKAELERRVLELLR